MFSDKMENKEANSKGVKIRITKVSRSDSYPDALKIIKDNDFTEDENFYYISFPEANNDLKQLFELIGTWKSTKIWLNDKEISKLNREARKTIFCPYFRECEGICKHNIGLGESYYTRDDPYYDKIIAEKESIIGLVNWAIPLIQSEEKDISEASRRVDYYQRDEIAVLSEDCKHLIFNRKEMEVYTRRKFQFESEFCPKFDEKKTLALIEKIPEQIVLSNSLTKEIRYYRELEKTRYLPISSTISDMEKETNEYEYEKKQAELIGDEVERRFRKVLSEFFERRK